jgi:hypothetical protein
MHAELRPAWVQWMQDRRSPCIRQIRRARARRIMAGGGRLTKSLHGRRRSNRKNHDIRAGNRSWKSRDERLAGGRGLAAREPALNRRISALIHRISRMNRAGRRAIRRMKANAQAIRLTRFSA